MGKPHPSHPFAAPHPTVYEIVRAAWEGKKTKEKMKNEKKNTDG
jgi:hypothetical protein